MHRRTRQSLEDFSRFYNPIIRGWVNYYGSFYRSKLHHALKPLNLILAKWAMGKYKKLRGHQRRAGRWINKIRKRLPYLFAH
ncbi:MAG: group II intron maturase-specific domain-containing protein [Planctomycetota bacterium]